MSVFEKAGCTILANACGPCVGQWKRIDVTKGTPNSIVTSFNRNFAGRNDGNLATHNFLASPEIVTAMSFSGSLDFNPVTDSLTGSDGRPFRFTPPIAADLPAGGFDSDLSGFQAPPEVGTRVDVVISQDSKRLQLLEPFPVWNAKNIENARVLIKVRGKCTTDHISMAGPWLKYRGHLDNLSNNCLIGAVNDDNGRVNSVLDHIVSEAAVADVYDAVPTVARKLKAANIDWIVIGDHNYGEGSAREQAALEPRYLGGRAIIAKSFARIHETNLKKQGMLPLTFDHVSDYDLISGRDRVSILGLDSLSPDKPLLANVVKPDGTQISIVVRHTFNDNQIQWFKAGSALNYLSSIQAGGQAAKIPQSTPSLPHQESSLFCLPSTSSV
uniref:Aconitase A/isopropylmalate dehydratase small subunit swivel domain-containing protein n=2 Tax=Spongospora subterranea TaxID=70186 RepID=A0A0H5R3V6_9EUKA|eukprot:CRZ02704.1 hypothetical protein [Spongospora subterranea]